MSKSASAAARHAGRAGVGLAVVATAVGVGVPAQAQPATPAPTAGGPAATPLGLPTTTPTMTYRVVAGDTLWGIAARTGSTVSAIARANGIADPDFIREGQMLRIPSAASRAPQRPSTPAASTATTSSSSAGSTYTVAAGDTLTRIAARHGTTVSALVSANAITTPDRIYVGQTLRLPSGNQSSGNQASGSEATRPSSGGSSAPAAAPGGTTTPASNPGGSARTHTVVAGDTVSGLASRYGTTVEAIVRQNNLSSAGLIYVGQRLSIGGSGGGSDSGSSSGTSSSSSAGTSSGSSSSSSGSVSYTVASGDTVSSIASRFGVTSQAIIAANNLGASATIHPGQTLTVPTSTNLVGDSFLGRTYPQEVVSSANANKAALLAMDVPSRAQMQAMVAQVARDMGVDPALAQAHAYQESGFNHASVSPANAIGTMQVIPSSGEWASQLVGRQLNLLDPYDNVVAGVAIIRQLHRTANSYDDAIAAYYQGLGGVNRNGWYPDTERYVQSVKSHMTRF